MAVLRVCQRGLVPEYLDGGVRYHSLVDRLEFEGVGSIEYRVHVVQAPTDPIQIFAVFHIGVQAEWRGDSTLGVEVLMEGIVELADQVYLLARDAGSQVLQVIGVQIEHLLEHLLIFGIVRDIIFVGQLESAIRFPGLVRLHWGSLLRDKWLLGCSWLHRGCGFFNGCSRLNN